MIFTSKVTPFFIIIALIFLSKFIKAKSSLIWIQPNLTYNSSIIYLFHKFLRLSLLLKVVYHLIIFEAYLNYSSKVKMKLRSQIFFVCIIEQDKQAPYFPLKLNLISNLS